MDYITEQLAFEFIAQGIWDYEDFYQYIENDRDVTFDRGCDYAKDVWSDRGGAPPRILLV